MFCFQAMEDHISHINFLMRFPAFLVIATSCFELSARQCFHLLYFALFSYIFNTFFSFLAVCPIHFFSINLGHPHSYSPGRSLKLTDES